MTAETRVVNTDRLKCYQKSGEFTFAYLDGMRLFVKEPYAKVDEKIRGAKA